MKTSRARFPHHHSGFSLVEVTLALAILTIGLVAILGLFPQGLQSSRDAADYTLASTAVNDIFSELRTSPFTAATLTNCVPLGTGPGGSYDLTTESRTVSNYYDNAGYIVSATSANRYFKMLVTFAPQPPLKLSQVTVAVVWPAKSVTPVNTNVFITNIAWYDQ